MTNEVVDWWGLYMQSDDPDHVVFQMKQEIERLKRYSLIVESYLDRETLKEVLTKYRATPDGRTLEPGSSPVPHGITYDRLGWLCSVCGGWNNASSKVECVHPHAKKSGGSHGSG